VIYRWLADIVVLAHCGFVLFVVLGGLLALRWRHIPWIHLPAAVWGVAIEWSGGICPLTPLENRFRRLGGEAGYAGGFVEHYLTPVLYPSGLTRPVQLFLGIAVVLTNLAVYAIVLRRGRTRAP
jgi:hypothetical protein